MKIKFLQFAVLFVATLFITACGEVESETVVEQDPSNAPTKALAGKWDGTLSVYQSDINTTCNYDILSIKLYENVKTHEVRGSIVADREEWIATQRIKGCIELINQQITGTFLDDVLSFDVDLDGLKIPVQTTFSNYLLNGYSNDLNTSKYNVSLINNDLKDAYELLNPDSTGTGGSGCSVASDGASAVDLVGTWSGQINNFGCYYELTIVMEALITNVSAIRLDNISHSGCPPTLEDANAGTTFVNDVFVNDNLDFSIKIDSNSTDTLNFVGSYNSQNMCGNAIHTYTGGKDSDWIWSVSKK